jgi:hypothetical protein
LALLLAKSFSNFSQSQAYTQVFCIQHIKETTESLIPDPYFQTHGRPISDWHQFRLPDLMPPSFLHKYF